MLMLQRGARVALAGAGGAGSAPIPSLPARELLISSTGCSVESQGASQKKALRAYGCQ